MSVKTALATDAVIDGNTQLTPKFAIVSVASAATDTAIVAAVAGKKLRVLSYTLSAAGTITAFQFNSKPGGAGTIKSGILNLPANTAVPTYFSPLGHFETVAGEGLTGTTGVGSTVTGSIVYVEV